LNSSKITIQGLKSIYFPQNSPLSIVLNSDIIRLLKKENLI